MIDNCKKYLELEKQWLEGNPTPEQESDLLHEMDLIWYRLSPEDIAELHEEKQMLR